MCAYTLPPCMLCIYALALVVERNVTFSIQQGIDRHRVTNHYTIFDKGNILYRGLLLGEYLETSRLYRI